MTERNDFYQLDEFSFGLCLKILEEYKETRFQIDALIESIGHGKIELKTLEALEGTFKEFGTSRKAKLYSSVLAQIKKENFPSEAD
ncbi:MAG: hypothetical protein IJ774_05870 [Selenomonadaceae bacterium]|nr:hypothetical protein [Selenomonadaceae bacterium]MBR1805903.1 hypothetical protein [Selenomonadaceae bacterium]